MLLDDWPKFGQNGASHRKDYPIRYLSVCSGIEAATVAWHPLGWEAAAFSDIEAFPRAVLAHHYPTVPCHGDFTTIGADDYGPIDLLVGGTPCQSFSIAGLRGGMADARGNLSLEYLRLADRKRPRWLVWENVPGVLSSNGGRDFGSILGGMGELGYGFAYRVLDAQHFGVPQRRRRVFVVGYLGDWRRAAAVLFERKSIERHNAPRERDNIRKISRTTASDSQKYPTVLKNVSSKRWLGNQEAFSGKYFINENGIVRYPTATEVERLFGFPDGYTDVPGVGYWDRIGMLGNSMAVPVMRWIGERIAAVDAIA